MKKKQRTPQNQISSIQQSYTPAPYLTLYCPFPNHQQAHLLATALLEKRWLACANLVKGQSLYWWDGRIQEDEEVFLYGKTHLQFEHNITHYLQEHHPYETPCILFYPIHSLDESYSRWMASVLI
jgi:periplasmic divalent cation tolerance protein